MRYNFLLIVICMALFTGRVFAQKKIRTNNRSNQPNKEVLVTSQYKPVLIGNTKWLFSNPLPIKDSTILPIHYAVPSFQINTQYLPQELAVLGITADTSVEWKPFQWVKLGAGNFQSFLGATKILFGRKDFNTLMEANQSSWKGKLPAQEFQLFQLASSTKYLSSNGHHWIFKPSYERSRQYFYGDYDSSSPTPKEQLVQRFSNLEFTASVNNSKLGAFGIAYQPNLKIARFYNDQANYENSLLLQVPMQKQLGKHFEFGLSILGDVSKTQISQPSHVQLIQNNLYSIEPSLMYFSNQLQIKAGITPTWNNQHFETLSQLSLSTQIGKSTVRLEAGLTGQYVKNTYRALFNINPYLNAPNSLLNTRKIEQYLRVSNQLTNHFHYRIGASLTHFENQALFVNAKTGKGFEILFEPSMRSFSLSGELMYRFQEKLSIQTLVNYHRYFSLANQLKPWGLVPIELNSSLSWVPAKDFLVQMNLSAWDGAHQLTKNQETRKLSPAADLSLSAHFGVLPKLNLWLEMNNIFNNTYQRWNKYPVLGFQILGGVVYSF